MTDTEKTVHTLVNRIVEEIHPIRIILFVSEVKDQDDAPDIDLLIVMPQGTHRRKTARELYRKLRGIRKPFDMEPVSRNEYKEAVALAVAVVDWAEKHVNG